MGRGTLIFGIIIFFILSLLAYVAWHGYRGYTHYARMAQTIEAIEEPAQREQAWEQLHGNDPRVYGGVLFATLPGHIWVMGAEGVRHYQTDNYTAYSSFDGCSPAILARLNRGEVGAVERQVTERMEAWREQVKIGDYVRAYPTNVQHLTESAGTEGNLREIYAYNFWLFMPTNMEERCRMR